MKKFAIEIKWGLIFIGVQLLWMIFERLVGLHDQYIAQHATYSNFFIVIAFVIYYFALTDKRKNYYGGRMTWKQGFISGLIIGLVVMVLTPLVQVLISNVISPHYFENAIAYAVESGNSTPEEAEAFFNLGNYILISTIAAPIYGAVTGAIMALFTRGPKAAPA